MARWYKGVSVDKDPADVFDVQMDYTQNLKSDSIATATATGSGITINSVATANGIVTAWISGGTNCSQGKIIFNITTVGARVKENTVLVNISDQ